MSKKLPLSVEAVNVLSIARTVAENSGSSSVDTEHLLLGLLEFGNGHAIIVLQRLRFNIFEMLQSTKKVIGVRGSSKHPGPTIPIHITSNVESVLVIAENEAMALNSHFVGTEHILLGLLSVHGSTTAKILTGSGVCPQCIRQEIPRCFF